MTVEIALVLAILAIAFVLFVTEVLRMDLVALLVLVSLALTGIVSPAEALAGFSNPAVITVWAMFILSAGLTRAGVAELAGSRLLRWVGRGELRMVVVIMLVAAILSAFMNNIGVAVLMLPVVIDVARRRGVAPSRLLMPLSFGSLLGGLTTLIGTPPNLLVSESMHEYGLEPFSMFDYTPVGGIVMLSGIAFIALVGRRLLPSRDLGREATASGLAGPGPSYGLEERSAMVRLPADSSLAGKMLMESRLGSATGLNVYAILRRGKTMLAPAPNEVLEAGDGLLVEGRLDRFNDMRGWRHLIVQEEAHGLDATVSAEIGLAELLVGSGAPLEGRTLGDLGFRLRFGAIVLALRRGETTRYTNLATIPLEAGDRLLVQARRPDLATVKELDDFRGSHFRTDAELIADYRLRERIFTVRIPRRSALSGRGLAECRLGDALGLGVLGLRREGSVQLLPGPEEILREDDELIVRGQLGDITMFRGLQGLEIETAAAPDLSELESDRAGLIEAMLSPRTSLAGKTPRQLRFRDRYGVQILAILREGHVQRSNIGTTELRFGDALLLLGPRDKLRVVGGDGEFLVISGQAPPAVDRRRAPVATLVMAAVLVPVLLGSLQISIAAVTGAALMVLLRCLSMDEALQSIEWRSIFLIAGMLPLGTALGKTGAAAFVAEGMVAGLQGSPPWVILLALCATTAVLTSIVPTAALVVLMAPVALRVAAALSLSPYAVMMAVAMAASASFTSPVSHPANLLVMGPGGYRFVDYVRLGVPLTILILVIVVLVLPLFWPLTV